jgi:hypothetical protein
MRDKACCYFSYHKAFVIVGNDKKSQGVFFLSAFFFVIALRNLTGISLSVFSFSMVNIHIKSETSMRPEPFSAKTVDVLALFHILSAFIR